MKPYSTKESLQAWEANAVFWDEAMGDASNDFHQNVVRPKVTQLLDPKPDDFILDAACGNGNYSAFLAERQVQVLAFDYSPNLVSLAQKSRHALGTKSNFALPMPLTLKVSCS